MLKLAGLLVGALLLADTVGVYTQVAARPRSIATESPSPPECLSRPAADIFVPNVVSGANNRIAIAANKTADFRNKPLVEDPPQYGLVIDAMEANGCITGLKMTGLASTSLTWNFRKGDFDGDGVLLKNITGSPAIVERIHFYNVMDGVSPRSTASNDYRWHVRAAYMVYIRDDAIENDQCLGGTIEDSLIDGVFMGFSSRPGKSSSGDPLPCPTGYQDNTFKIKNVVLRLECQPYDSASKSSSGCTSNTAVGQLFKWRTNTPVPVDVQDSIFVQPSLSNNGNSAMCYRPPGTYKNVVIIWQGPGAWPCNEPPGVTVTTDIGIWNQARAAWLQRYGCAADGGYCPFTSL